MERRGAGDDPGARRLTDGTEIPAAAVVRAAGFRVPVPAREAGIAVDARGVITVDAAPRSVPHPEVFAAGDAAGAYGIGGPRPGCPAGRGLPMGGAGRGQRHHGADRAGARAGALCLLVRQPRAPGRPRPVHPPRRQPGRRRPHRAGGGAGEGGGGAGHGVEHAAPGTVPAGPGRTGADRTNSVLAGAGSAGADRAGASQVDPGPVGPVPAGGDPAGNKPSGIRAGPVGVSTSGGVICATYARCVPTDREWPKNISPGAFSTCLQHVLGSRNPYSLGGIRAPNKGIPAPRTRSRPVLIP
ncbi:FAD-dependent oxidoreductase [Streptomyces sp. NPDC088554]|uniref:FAD-dependent oxidoreductase n=1 Tax=Streptomyces sp. NPDC088554 TaxID=3365865 RepID=UPI00382423CF